MKVRYLLISAALAALMGATTVQAANCMVELDRLANMMDADEDVGEALEAQIDAILQKGEELCNAGKEEEANEVISQGIDLLEEKKKS